MIDVPKELCWDYPEPPEDELWRLQRIVDFFPQFGRDWQTVERLVARLDELKMPPEIRKLIGIYAAQHGVARGT